MSKKRPLTSLANASTAYRRFGFSNEINEPVGSWRRSPDHLLIRNAQNYASDSPAESISYKKRTKSGSHQLWRERALERAFEPFWRHGQSTGPTRNARRYWAFEGAAEVGETFGSRITGGASEPEIQRSPLRLAAKVIKLPSWRSTQVSREQSSTAARSMGLA